MTLKCLLTMTLKGKTLGLLILSKYIFQMWMMQGDSSQRFPQTCIYTPNKDQDFIRNI